MQKSDTVKKKSYSEKSNSDLYLIGSASAYM